MNLIFLAALLILTVVWLEEFNYRHVNKKVKERWASGDKSCAARKVWWGWRVVEYAEDVDSQL